MGVKSSVGQTGTSHDFIQSRFGHAPLAKSLTGRVENSLPGNQLMSRGVAHVQTLYDVRHTMQVHSGFGGTGRPQDHGALEEQTGRRFRALVGAAPHAGFDFAPRRGFRPPLLNMQQLHAYWRMEYIEAPRYPARMKRPFTELPELRDDRAALIVHRAKNTYLVLNRFPYNPGHVLAIPFREVTELEELTPAECTGLMMEIVFAKRLLAAALKPDGFNVGFNLGSAAGGSIPHLHAHIVPRWNGDTNFMPVIGQTRTLPQSLEQTWERLAETAALLSRKRTPRTVDKKAARKRAKVSR